ncbi:serine/threonine kinase [Aureococcus anophagefferens]|nr:serine/threonine kinase [Aureococcus anophagefferens]
MCRARDERRRASQEQAGGKGGQGQGQGPSGRRAAGRASSQGLARPAASGSTTPRPTTTTTLRRCRAADEEQAAATPLGRVDAARKVTEYAAYSGTVAASAFMPGVVAFLATLVAATVIGQLMTQSLYDAATAVGDWGVKTKAGSTSLHSASARRHLCFFVNGLKDVGGCIYTRVKALLPDALSTMVCFVKKIVTGDMVHFRVHVNQAVKSPYARSLGRHADALLWPVFVAACVTHALWQLRVVIGTAPATLVFTIMVVDTKGRAMEKHGVFAMEQLVVPAYVAYMLTPMAAGQIDVGYVVIDGERLALRIFHCVLGVGYTRVAMIMTWLVDGEEGAEAARRRLKRLARTGAVANNPPPDCEFVPETAEEKRAMHLEVQRQKDRARDCRPALERACSSFAPFSDYDALYTAPDEELGRGASGVVRKAYRRSDGLGVAVKTMDLRALRMHGGDAFKIKKLRREVDVLRTLAHENIVHLYGAGDDTAAFGHGARRGRELFDAILSRGHYSEADARPIFVQLLKAVDYMHQRNVIHRDLKPERAARRRRLEDFSGVDLSDGSMAYDAKVDSWSLGVTLYVMLVARFPVYHRDERGRIFGVKRAERAADAADDAARRREAGDADAASRRRRRRVWRSRTTTGTWASWASRALRRRASSARSRRGSAGLDYHERALASRALATKLRGTALLVLEMIDDLKVAVDARNADAARAVLLAVRGWTAELGRECAASKSENLRAMRDLAASAAPPRSPARPSPPAAPARARWAVAEPLVDAAAAPGAVVAQPGESLDLNVRSDDDILELMLPVTADDLRAPDDGAEGLGDHDDHSGAASTLLKCLGELHVVFSRMELFWSKVEVSLDTVLKRLRPRVPSTSRTRRLKSRLDPASRAFGGARGVELEPMGAAPTPTARGA